MDIRDSSRLLVRAFRRHGVFKTLGLIPKSIAHEFRWYLDRAFDRTHGTDTSQVIELHELTIKGSNAIHGQYYEPTSTNLFRFMMRKLPIHHEDFAFVDFGSGKGRTLLLASEYPFRKIEGVEFSQELHETATRNIGIFRSPRQRCRNIVPLHMDAVDYVFPPHDLVIYLYNPFGAAVIRRVLENLRHSLLENPRKILIVYFNVLSGHIYDEQDFLPFKTELKLPYDWSRRHQRQGFAYSNFPLVAKSRTSRPGRP